MRNAFKFAFLAIVLAVFMVAGLGRPAHADLAAVGPVDPAPLGTGFPLWFEDALGLRVQLCDEGGAVAEEPPCLPELIDPNGGFVAGNIGEALYYAAVAEFTGLNGESILAQCVVEAAGPELPGDGDTVGNAALIRLRGLTVAGVYNIVTPCGVFGPFEVACVEDPVTQEVTCDDIRDEIAVIGLLADAPLAFSGALPGPVQIFATNNTGAPGFLGDAITEGTLSSPLRPGGVTAVTVSGAISATSDQFTVVGKVSGCTEGNLAPVANPDQAVTAASTPVIIPVLANDVNDPLQVNGANINPATVAIVTPPLEPSTAVANPDGTVTFTPGVGVTGEVTFTYTVQDFCQLISNVALVTVLVDDIQAQEAGYRTRQGKWSVNGLSSFVGETVTVSVGPRAFLSGDQEVPPVETQGRGYSLVVVSRARDAITYTLSYTGLTGVTQAHIHNGAIGVNGPVNVFLCTNLAPPAGVPVPPACPETAGTVTGTLTAADFIAAGPVTTFDELLTAILNGGAYVNVHTTGVPTGEIRGQIERDPLFTVTVPAGGAWQAQGKSSVTPGPAPRNVVVQSTSGVIDNVELQMR